jgi:hypothetical protein
MRVKYFRRVGGVILATLLLCGTALVSSSTVQAQTGRRVVIVRPSGHRFYRPYPYRYRSWWNYDPWWRYDPWSPYGNYYSQYVFGSSESAYKQGYEDGYKTGNKDGKKSKSYSPERSHYFKESGFGNFAEVYRPAFSKGYRDGYQEGRTHAG